MNAPDSARAPEPLSPAPRAYVDLVIAQVSALAAWHAYRNECSGVDADGLSREERLDLNRAQELLRAQHEALVSWLERDEAPAPLPDHVPVRAVVGHRNEWFRRKLSEVLTEAGVAVVTATDNGAVVAGIAVAEQADLVLVEDRLVMMTGQEVLRLVRRFVPDALSAIQVERPDDVSRAMELGVAAAFSRRVPPADVAAELCALLADAATPRAVPAQATAGSASGAPDRNWVR